MESRAFRSVQIALMLHTFANALDVEPPRLPAHPDAALRTFALFTAACAQEATSGAGESGGPLHETLYERAHALGKRVRQLPLLRSMPANELVSALYRNIEIELSGALPGEVVIPACYFARCYSPRCCRFMSAFDRGIIEGIAGSGTLQFTERLTEGAPCCRARLG